jgi:crotonobetainyl-CoA:carnitine CoA-transferase CaiB-like acyl-CoA transferase
MAIESHQPLDGVTVIELGTSVAAPVAGMVLAELGARVIKVENPQGGDDARRWGPPFEEGVAPVFLALNRNKRSAAIDLKDPAQVEALRSFIKREADVVLQNLRPGLVVSYGLDASTLRADKSNLIYCNLGAFGATGPQKAQPGYDPLMQACCGIMSVTGHPRDEPIRVGPSIVDQGAGMWCVIGILAALNRRLQTGEGCTVDTSLYETAIGWVSQHTANLQVSGAVPSKLGSENAGIAPYKAYEADGGWIVIAVGNDALFRKLCAVIDRKDWISDPLFATNPDRVRNRALLNALLNDIVKLCTPAEWRAKLDAAGIPCAPVLALDAVVADPQFEALRMLQPASDGKRSLIGLPLSFDGVRPPLRRSPPALGEGTSLISSSAVEEIDSNG